MTPHRNSNDHWVLPDHLLKCFLERGQALRRRVQQPTVHLRVMIEQVIKIHQQPQRLALLGPVSQCIDLCAQT